MVTSQVTRFSFTWFTGYQAPITHDPRRQTLPQLQKWRYAIRSAFCQYLSTNKSWPPYKKLKPEHYDITKILLPLENQSKYITAKENLEAFSRSLRVHLVKYTTISSSKTLKSHVKLVTNMHYENGFELLITVVFNTRPQLWGLVTKSQDLLIPFCLGEG